MSLDWNAQNACAWNELDDQQKEAAIFGTIAVGIGDITGKNLAEYIARTRLLDQLDRGIFVKQDANGKATPAWTDADLLKVEGLRTNVSYESRAKWLSRVTAESLDQAERNAREAYQEIHGSPMPSEPEPSDLARKLRAAFNTYRLSDDVERYAKDLAREVGIRDVGHLDIYVSDEINDLCGLLGPVIVAAIVEAVEERDTEEGA